MKIFDFLQEHSVAFKQHGEHHHVTHGWINVDCPYCSPDSQRFRLGWNLTQKYFCCWTCGAQRTRDTLCLLAGISPLQAEQTLNWLDPELISTKTPALGKYTEPIGVQELAVQHRDYLRLRGYNPYELATQWRLGGIGQAFGWLAWRIFVPIYFDGKPVSWTTRSILPGSKGGPKYLSAKPEQENFSIKSLLYGEDAVPNKRSIVIFEGPTSVWRYGPGSVALFGVNATKKQILRLSQYQRRIICFDSDEAGQKQADWLYEKLACFPGDTEIVQTEAPDFAEAEDAEIQELKQHVAT